MESVSESLPLCGRLFDFVGGRSQGAGITSLLPVLEEIQLVLEQFVPKEIKEDFDGYIRGDPEPWDRYGRMKKNAKRSVLSSAPRKYVPPEVCVLRGSCTRVSTMGGTARVLRLQEEQRGHHAMQRGVTWRGAAAMPFRVSGARSHVQSSQCRTGIRAAQVRKEDATPWDLHTRVQRRILHRLARFSGCGSVRRCPSAAAEGRASVHVRVHVRAEEMPRLAPDCQSASAFNSEEESDASTPSAQGREAEGTS